MLRKTALVRRVVLAGCLVLSVAVGACQEPDSEVVSEGEYLVFDVIGRGNLGVAADSLVRVIRDEATWVAFRDSLRPPEPFGPVDFDQSIVIAIALPREYGGYSIAVSSVEKRTDDILVEYELNEPASDCLPLVGTSLPFEVVRVRRADGPIRFERDSVPYRCTWKQ